MTEPEKSQNKESGNGIENESPLQAQHPKDVQNGTPFSEEQVSYLKLMLKECVSEATKEVRLSNGTPGGSQLKSEC